MQPGAQPPAAAGQAGAVPVSFAMPQDLSQLSQMSGIPLQQLTGNPQMQMMAQQAVMQRMMLAQAQASGQLRPGAVMPAQLQAMQQAMLAQQRMVAAAAGAAPAAATAPKKRGRGGARGARGGAAAAAAAAAAVVPAAFVAAMQPANPFADPGGKVVWAKVGSYPWWPAKTLDPARDASYPPDADPPRPTSIPIRFFGTYEFQWIGSKRQLADWDEHHAAYSRECEQSSFKAALQEVAAYKETGRLPDTFYVTPEPEKPKGKARGGAARKRGRSSAATEGAEAAAALMASTAAAAAAGKSRAAGRAAELTPAERAPLVQQRRKQRLREWGLLPPDDTPYVGGRVAPNPNLLQLEGQWREQHAGAIEEQRRADEVLAQRKAAAAAEAAARRAAVAEAQRQAAETAAAAAAAANPLLAMQMQQAALAGQAGMLPAGLLQQMMQQGGGAQAAAGTPPIVG